jgi:ABC-type transport system involved in cytochrome bd biosynthesis fused ATPase/permease subunit
METIIIILLSFLVVFMNIISIRLKKQVNKYKKVYEKIQKSYLDREKLIEIENKQKDNYIDNLKYHNKEQEKLYYQLLNASKLINKK